MKVIKKNKALLAIMIILITPVIAAKLFVVNKWYQEGKTNKGILLTQDINYKKLNAVNSNQGYWQIGYMLQDNCNYICKNKIKILKNAIKALGREQNRVKLTLLTNKKNPLNNSFKEQVIAINRNENIKQNNIFIIDPLGKFVLKYVFHNNNQLQESGNMLKDLRKLMKLSKVG